MVVFRHGTEYRKSAAYTAIQAPGERDSALSISFASMTLGLEAVAAVVVSGIQQFDDAFCVRLVQLRVAEDGSDDGSQSVLVSL